jgi:hypothetical protein
MSGGALGRGASESQLLFLQNGLAAGLAVSSFLLVEWHIRQSA